MSTAARVMLLLFLCSIAGDIRCQSDNPASDGDDGGQVDADDGGDDDEQDAPGEDCQPSIADTCFNDLSENILCHVDTPVDRNCTFRNSRDFCVGLDDALNCTSDIVDNGCSAEQGRDTFDVWLRGMRAVHRALCLGRDLSLIDNILKSSNCWKFKKFVKCAEETANITHVSDLLTTKLDRYECNLLQLSVGMCNADSEKNHWKCRGKAEAVQRALAVFFAHTSCGEDTSCSRASAHTVQVGGSSGSAVVLTLVVMLVVLSLVGAILVKHKVLTIQARRPQFCVKSSTTNDDQEDYDRFQ
ncbi:uncharacterized protein [Procambarus clarkii]|uniref:uncharacterized protein n=1 Tax=Procambarus clarkii TaxID=6728 RepID=UPI001E674D08|nr:uncharacterized protein LOC123764013 [Procambarus clarkii]